MARWPWRTKFLCLSFTALVIDFTRRMAERISHARVRIITPKARLRELGGRTLVDTESLITLIDSAKDWTPKNRGGEARKKRADVARAALQG